MLQSGKPECGASFFEYHTTVPLKTIHTIFNSPLYEGTQLITYTQENCTRLPAKDNCLFAFTAREEASRLEGKREREKGYSVINLIIEVTGCGWSTEGASSSREGAIRRRERVVFWISKDLRGEECSIWVWRFDRRESSFEIKRQTLQSGGELIHSSGVGEDFEESFGKFEEWKSVV